MTVFARQREQLQTAIKQAVQTALESGKLELAEVPEVGLEIPRNPSHGDFASNIALATARAARKSPREVAEIIVGNLDSTHIDRGDCRPRLY